MATDDQSRPISSSFPTCTAAQCNVAEEDKAQALHHGAESPRCGLMERCVESCEANNRVCPCAARIASQYACARMASLSENSRVFEAGKGDTTTKPPITDLNSEDITILEKLGKGGYSNVNKCRLAALPPSDAAPHHHHHDRTEFYAVKYLQREAMIELAKFKAGAADLATEAHFLHTLQHPHIVKLHGITAGSVETNVATGKECGFFIVVDLLQETLEQRLEQWKKDATAEKTTLTRDETQRLLRERCQIAMAIADVMEYLHSKNIVFRDLKPDNIGFDADGTLKIFDFGLAKELKSTLQAADNEGAYHMTGQTGSRRYMAPEVMRELPYGTAVDVYSFGILLWELCTHGQRKPFYGYSASKYQQKVAVEGERPSLDPETTARHWPMALQWLIRKCWAPEPSQRPSFTTVRRVLQDILDSKDNIPSEWLAEEQQQREQALPSKEQASTKSFGFARLRCIGGWRSLTAGGRLTARSNVVASKNSVG